MTNKPITTLLSRLWNHRAFYKQAAVQAIESISQDLVLLIIAHHRINLKNCVKIEEFEGGGIKRSGSYQDLMNQLAVTPK